MGSPDQKRRCPRILAVFGALWGLLALACPARSGQAPEALEFPAAQDSASRYLLGRWLDALGGAQRVGGVRHSYFWARMESRAATARVEEWNSAAGEIRTVTEFATFRRRSGFDGHRGYEVDENGKLRELLGPSLAALRTEALLTCYGLFFDRPIRGQARHEGAAWNGPVREEVLRIQADGGQPQWIHLDVATGLPSRAHRVEDRDTVWTEYLRYQGVDGVQEAVELKTWRTGAADSARFHVEGLQHPARPPSPDTYAFPADTLRDVLFPADADSAQLCFEWWDEHIVVLASLAGEGPLPFLLDTGAEASNLDLSLARRLRLTREAPMQLSGTGGEQQAWLVRLDTLELGGVRLLGQRVAAVDLSGVRPGGRELAGVLGYDFLSRFRIRVVPSQRTITLHAAGADPEPAGTAFPVDLDSYVPRLDLMVNDSVPARFLVDTGAPTSAVFFRGFWTVHDLLAADAPSRPVTTAGVGGTSTSREARFGSLSLGPYRIPQPIAFFRDSEAGSTRSVLDAGLLGMGFLRRFDFTLDYSRRRLYLAPDSAYATSEESDMSGLSLQDHHQDVRVADVEAGSAAAAAGIQPGDVVLSVDGRPASAMGATVVAQRLRARPGLPVLLRLESDGRARTVRLVLRKRI